MKRHILFLIVLALSLFCILLGNSPNIRIPDSAMMALFGLSTLAAALLLKAIRRGKPRFEARSQGEKHEPGIDG